MIQVQVKVGDILYLRGGHNGKTCKNWCIVKVTKIKKGSLDRLYINTLHTSARVMCNSVVNCYRNNYATLLWRGRNKIKVKMIGGDYNANTD